MDKTKTASTYAADIEAALARHTAARAEIEREAEAGRKRANNQLTVDLREAGIRHAAAYRS